MSVLNVPTNFFRGSVVSSRTAKYPILTLAKVDRSPTMFEERSHHAATSRRTSGWLVSELFYRVCDRVWQEVRDRFGLSPNEVIAKLTHVNDPDRFSRATAGESSSAPLDDGGCQEVGLGVERGMLD